MLVGSGVLVGCKVSVGFGVLVGSGVLVGCTVSVGFGMLVGRCVLAGRGVIVGRDVSVGSDILVVLALPSSPCWVESLGPTRTPSRLQAQNRASKLLHPMTNLPLIPDFQN